MKISDIGIKFQMLPFKCYSLEREQFQPRLLKPEGITIHYFSCRYVKPERPFNTELCWQLMHDLNFKHDERLYDLYHGKKTSSSAHFMIGRDGTGLQLVPLEYQAWHAGKSEYAGRKHCNKFMLGIEFIGSYQNGPTESQYKMLAKLCAFLVTEYNISTDMIVGHEDIAPGRKKDPHGHGDDATFSWPTFHAALADELNNQGEF